MKKQKRSLFLLTLNECNGEYEYTHIGLIEAACQKEANVTAERIAKRWYDDEYDEDDGVYFFHHFTVSVAVADITFVAAEDADALRRHLPMWDKEPYLCK